MSYKTYSKILNALIALFVVALLGAGVWWLVSIMTDAPKTDDPRAISARVQGLDVTYDDKDVAQSYDNPDLGVSFSYPEKGITEVLEEGDWQTVIVRDEKGREAQVAVQEFTEAGPLTPERIKRDVAGLTMNNVRNLTLNPSPQKARERGGEALSPEEGRVGERFVKGIYFETETTREVWFATRGKMYQISEVLNGGGLLEPVLATMKL